MINTEKIEVHSWAIICPKTLTIQCYLSPTVPNYDKTCNEYKRKGFHVAKLYGEIEIAEETVTITRSNMESILGEATSSLKPNFCKHILKEMGFERGLK